MRRLLNEITCLHCWTSFKVEEVLWISEHPSLRGDTLLGEDAQLRFLPTRFTVAGDAIDARGEICRDLGCPKCHLPLPKGLLETSPHFISILGTPSCGKSYFLSAMTGRLRRQLPLSFNISFNDADTVSNQLLINNEESLLLQHDNTREISPAQLIPKTQLHGDLYHSVRRGEHVVTYAQPFSFLMSMLEQHPSFLNGQDNRRVVSLYDNAGEHFLPGQDSVSAPGTRHLAESAFLIFLYDPSQDPRWRNAMEAHGSPLKDVSNHHSIRQESVLQEAANRVRRLRGLSDGTKNERPLIVVVNKSDLWKSFLPREVYKSPLRKIRVNSEKKDEIVAVDLAAVQSQSDMLREVLRRHVPEIVITAEEFCSTVYYVHASALGVRPTIRDNGESYIRAADIRPKNVMLPFLLGMGLSTEGLIPFVHARTTK
jgi:hypothetical protein